MAVSAHESLLWWIITLVFACQSLQSPVKQFALCPHFPYGSQKSCGFLGLFGLLLILRMKWWLPSSSHTEQETGSVADNVNFLKDGLKVVLVGKKKSPGPVLTHCALGVRHCTTVVLDFLMIYEGMTLVGASTLYRPNHRSPHSLVSITQPPQTNGK